MVPIGAAEILIIVGLLLGLFLIGLLFRLWRDWRR
jgi:hypothetical protein